MSDPSIPASGESGSAEEKPLSYRVPEHVARGVFTTGQVILGGQREFMIDFLQGLTRPAQVVARVILPPATMGEFVQVLRQNIDNYTRAHGPPTELPPPSSVRPSLREIYDNFRLADEMLSGTYANVILVAHSITEFFIDFITTFPPTPSLSARVYLPAPQAPRLLASAESSFQTYQGRNPNSGSTPDPQP